MTIANHIGVRQIDGKNRVVFADRGAEKEWAVPAEQQLEPREESGARMIEAQLSILESEHVSMQIEHSERVPMFEDPARGATAIAVGDDREMFFEADDFGHDADGYANNPDFAATSCRYSST
jgi:hypothetical protein